MPLHLVHHDCELADLLRKGAGAVFFSGMRVREGDEVEAQLKPLCQSEQVVLVSLGKTKPITERIQLR